MFIVFLLPHPTIPTAINRFVMLFGLVANNMWEYIEDIDMNITALAELFLLLTVVI